MTKKLGVWLTGAAIHALGDRYDGRVADVREQPIRNKWTMQTSVEAVLVFDDGKQLVLSHGMLVELMGRFGSESDDWVGHSISLGTRPAERKGKVVWERFLFAAEATPHITDRGQDPIDQDDSLMELPEDPDAELTAFPFGRRRR